MCSGRPTRSGPEKCQKLGNVIRPPSGGRMAEKCIFRPREKVYRRNPSVAAVAWVSGPETHMRTTRITFPSFPDFQRQTQKRAKDPAPSEHRGSPSPRPLACRFPPLTFNHSLIVSECVRPIVEPVAFSKRYKTRNLVTRRPKHDDGERQAAKGVEESLGAGSQAPKATQCEKARPNEPKQNPTKLESPV